jgi:F-type H+-transporting ATPase subunit delta
MGRTRQAKRDAKRLLRLCLAGGLLDEGRVREVVRRVAASGNRNRLKVLAELRRLVKLDVGRHTATVETAAPLSAGMRERIQAGLARMYGSGLSTTFAGNPALIGGMRIKVGSDVYDSSVQARLAALQERF